jgi:hypothetical protein
MRLAALSFAIASLFAATAHANISPQQAASVLKPALQRSAKISDKSPFRTRLGSLVKGTKYVRNFTANNMHMVHPTVQGTFQPHFGFEAGGIAKGTINLRTSKVKITSYSLAR